MEGKEVEGEEVETNVTGEERMRYISRNRGVNEGKDREIEGKEERHWVETVIDGEGKIKTKDGKRNNKAKKNVRRKGKGKRKVGLDEDDGK